MRFSKVAVSAARKSDAALSQSRQAEPGPFGLPLQPLAQGHAERCSAFVSHGPASVERSVSIARARFGDLRRAATAPCHPSGAGAKLFVCELVFDAILMSDSAETGAPLQLVAAPAIGKRILVVRERQVMLDEDLADLYGVETKRLIEQVQRNRDRFPADFMFQLTKDEAAALRSQIATSNTGRGGRRYAPYVFTEQGVAMLSGVLRSERAIAVNIEIMRAFVELRRAATSSAAIERRLEELEQETSATLGRHDKQLRQIFDALRLLIAPPPRPKRRDGFGLREEED